MSAFDFPIPTSRLPSHVLIPTSSIPLPSIFKPSPPALPKSFPYPIDGPLPASRFQPGDIIDTCQQPSSYAISFDDGPGQLTDTLLDYLDDLNVKVTFFLNGNNWNCIYRPQTQRLLRRAYKAQHQLAAHPWSHRDLETLTDDEIRAEMGKIETAFRQIIGVVPRYMRPPYGEHSERVRRVLADMGYVLVLWDVDFPFAGAGAVDAKTATSTSSTIEGGHHQMMPTLADLHSALHQEHLQQQQMALSSSSSSRWADAIRGVAHFTLDREDIFAGGDVREPSSEWAVEYVQQIGLDVMPVGACVGEDPRHWYKEIGEPANLDAVPHTCSNL
ncbi:Carbohydrate esterase 4 protein [Actinomortierella ambigua]|nr:Carbohydrate esterase 4 protein [Actinomortierella ambigua]